MRLEPGTGSIILGDFVDIQPGAILASQGGNIRLGNNVSVNAYSVLYGEGGLVIGSDVRIAAHVVIIPANHRFSDRNLPIRKQGRTKLGITIEDDVWIGAGAKVLDGSHIGKGCVIAANAVVRGRLDPYGVYGGIPVKRIRDR